MESRPEILGGDSERFADFLRIESVEFPQEKSVGDTGGEFRQAAFKRFPKLAILKRASGIAAPVQRRVFPMPAAIERRVSRIYAKRVVSQRFFSHRLAMMIDDFVSQDADEPGPLARTPGEILASAKCVEERLLNGIRSQIGSAETRESA